MTQDTFAPTIKPAMLSSAASVLVVDDDRDSLNAVRAVLQGLGLAIVTADNAEEAIGELDKGFRPKLVLIDLMLPRVSGWDLLQYMREKPELRDIRTVVVTGFPRENLRVIADAVLHKPVAHDRLVNTVLKLLERDSTDTARTAGV